MSSQTNYDASVERRRRKYVALQRECVCPACGGAARRQDARFCATCGRKLDTDGYRPADSIRASYHHHRRRPKSAGAKYHAGKPGAYVKGATGFTLLFMKEQNGAARTALACVTYALVPYLGILFCPFAIIFGGIGLRHAVQTHNNQGRRASSYSVVMGIFILGAQLLLWWILYKVPEWAQR